MEVAEMRQAFGPEPKLVVPGVRPRNRADDQKRTLDPVDAVASGASRLVIGRPITAEPDPLAAAQAIVADLNRSRGAA
jgi:orotidine-5'-phosphate decarboxylase